MKRKSNFFVCFEVGKQTQETCRTMLTQFSKRIQKPTSEEKLEIFSDGNDDYTVVLAELFPTNTITYGQIVKVREKGRVVDKIKRVVYGTPAEKDIDTVYVENFNGILRGQLSRLVRKTKCFGKRKTRLENAIHLFQFYWNFMHPLDKKLTPAIQEGKATKIWTWGNFLHAQLRYTQ